MTGSLNGRHGVRGMWGPDVIGLLVQGTEVKGIPFYRVCPVLRDGKLMSSFGDVV